MNIVVALVHIGGATIWPGGAFFYTVVLQPKLGALDTAQQRVLSRSLRATMTPLLAVSAAATIASGLVMMVQLHHLHTGPFLARPLGGRPDHWRRGFARRPGGRRRRGQGQPQRCLGKRRRQGA